MTLLTMIVKMGEGLSKTCAIFFLTPTVKRCEKNMAMAPIRMTLIEYCRRLQYSEA